MDINSMTTEQRAEAMKKGLCFRCGKQGHLNRDCPDKKGKKPVEKKEEKEEVDKQRAANTCMSTL